MRFAAAIKIAVIGALALALFVPVAMIQGLVAERQMRRDEVVSGIAEGWGKRQTIAGPYLVVPYERHWTEVTRETVEGKLTERRTEHSESHVLRLPVMDVEWSVLTEVGEKARGIFRARLYTARLGAQGSITIPGRASYEDGTSRYKWGVPILVVGISDPVGLLTALSEHIDFTAAYAAATLACVGLVSGYLVRVLKSALAGLAFGGALAALYAMLYALLKAEDYSLLGGALLLFGLLTIVMIATRRVDWYALSARAQA